MSHRNCTTRRRFIGFGAVLTLATAASLPQLSNLARADIFQWEYVNPADHSQGKQPSATLAPGGAGVSAVPGADLTSRNLTMAYLIGADLTNAYLSFSTLSDADVTGAQIRGAYFNRTGFAGGGLTPAQIYSTASYQEQDLTGVHLDGNLLS